MKKFFRDFLKGFADPDTWILLSVFLLSQALFYAICLYLNGLACTIAIFLWFALFEFAPIVFTYLVLKHRFKKAPSNDSRP